MLTVWWQYCVSPTGGLAAGAAHPCLSYPSPIFFLFSPHTSPPLLLLDFQSWPVLLHSDSLLLGLSFVSMPFMYGLQHQAGNLKELYRRRQLAVHGYVTLNKQKQNQ